MIGDEILASTTPNAAQQSSIQGLLAEAATALVANPSGFVSSLNAIVSPFPFASAVQSYENGLISGMQTVFASDLSLSVPTASATSSSSSAAAAAPARSTGLIAGGVAMAAGLVGAALL